jgi:hypothetical protein
MRSKKMAKDSSGTLTIRILGRFLFVPQGPLKDKRTRCERLRVIGPGMNKNLDLGFGPHFMMLTVPLSSIDSYTKRPDSTVFSPGPQK